MEGNYRQKSMYLAFILTSYILDAWLYFYMYVSCFHSSNKVLLTIQEKGIFYIDIGHGKISGKLSDYLMKKVQAT